MCYIVLQIFNFFYVSHFLNFSTFYWKNYESRRRKTRCERFCLEIKKGSAFVRTGSFWPHVVYGTLITSVTQCVIGSCRNPMGSCVKAFDYLIVLWTGEGSPAGTNENLLFSRVCRIPLVCYIKWKWGWGGKVICAWTRAANVTGNSIWTRVSTSIMNRPPFGGHCVCFTPQIRWLSYLRRQHNRSHVHRVARENECLYYKTDYNAHFEYYITNTFR